MKKIMWLITIFGLVTSSYITFANSITSINVSGGGQNSTVSISVSVLATEKVNNSNIRIQIIAPNGNVMASTQLDTPSLNDGDTWQGQWTANNNPPVIGDYTVSVCWSPGNSGNCNFASSSTTYYSADTLEILLPVLIVFLISLFLYQEHKVKG